VLAGFFGAGPITDAFIAAFRVPNLFRRLFGEGTLGISFVPVFTEVVSLKGREAAFGLALSAVRLLALILATLAVAGVAAAPWITRAVAYGLADSADTFQLAVTLTRIMFPYIFCIGMVALFMAILNVLGHFAAPALAPVLLNAAMIVSVCAAAIFTRDPVQRVYALAVGVLAGGVLQLGFQLPFLIRQRFRFWQSAALVHPALKKIGAMYLPATFGAAVFQINTLACNLLASFQAEGSISYLYYADRLVQFPLGIFGIATATAVLPSFSRLAADGDLASLRETLSYALRFVFFITLPAMAGLMVLGQPIVALLFERGAFDAAATRATAHALFFYTTGLWAFAGVRIVVAVFYALQDTVTPVKCAAVAIAANLLLAVVLVKPMGFAGLALALSSASIVNMVLLAVALRKRLGSLGGRPIVTSACKMIACSAIMGLAVRLVSNYVGASGTHFIPAPAAVVGAGVLTGVVVYAVAAQVTGVADFKRFARFAGKSLKRR
jgi:putative peptidoglycan lipid II flippase